MANRFEELEPVLIDLAAAIDDPDSCGAPETFITKVQRLTKEAADIASQLTLEDFEEEYEESESV